jgi:hypothetical protein
MITPKTSYDTEVATHKPLVGHDGKHLGVHIARLKNIAQYEHMRS